MSILIGLASNVAANIIFWVLLGAVFWAISTVVARRFSQFFGLRHVNRVGVYLSNLWTRETSHSGRPEGYTISLHELRAAQSVEKLFGSAPLRLPDLVRGLVDTLWLRGQVQCATDVCPVKGENADLDRNLIIVGGSVRNTVRAHYVGTGLPTAILPGEKGEPPQERKATTITISRNGSTSEITLPESNLAVVERCHDRDRGITIFFCLGARADSSWAATEYLVRNWGRLAKEYGGRDFVICLGFPGTDGYLEEYKEPLRFSLGGVA